MAKPKGEIIAINGNMIQVRFKDNIIQNEVGYVLKDNQRLKSEVIKIEADIAYLQVFEITKA